MCSYASLQQPLTVQCIPVLVWQVLASHICVGAQLRLNARKAQARKVQQAHCSYSELSQQLLQSCDAQLAELHQLLAEGTYEGQQQQQQMGCAPQDGDLSSGEYSVSS